MLKALTRDTRPATVAPAREDKRPATPAPAREDKARKAAARRLAHAVLWQLYRYA